MGGGGAGAGEQRGLGPGHPDLAVAGLEPLEEGRAAARIEMGGDFIEEEDRRRAAGIGDQRGVGENKTKQ